MKATLLLLLGLLTISHSTEHSGEQFSWDSSDENTRERGLSYSGIIIQVYKPDGEEPTITLGTDADHDNVYCFKFLRTFEAINYDITTSEDSTYTEVENSAVDLSKVNCTTSETSTSTFTITCKSVNDGILSFIFKFTDDTDGDYGLEYTVNMEHYSFKSTDSSAQLVLVQSLEECSNEYPYSADSSDEVSATNNDFGHDEDETTEKPDDDTTTTEDVASTERRRLSNDNEGDGVETDDGSDSNSRDSGDGISSDDSDEFDAGFAKFVVDGQALDKCDGVDDKAIGSGLVYQSTAKELHIVFNHFECDLSLDPFLGVDHNKISAARRYHIIIGMIMGFVAIMLF